MSKAEAAIGWSMGTIVVAGTLALGCTSEEAPGKSGTGRPGSGDDGGGGASSPQGGFAPTGGSTGIGGAESEGGTRDPGASEVTVFELGGVTFEDISNTACAHSLASPIALYGQDNQLPLGALAQVGARFVAGGAHVPGFVTFDADGSNPSEVLAIANQFHAVFSMGTTFGVIGADAFGVFARTYSEDNTELSASTFSDDEDVHAIAGTGSTDSFFAVWSTQQTHRASIVEGSTQTPVFEFGAGTFEGFAALSAAERANGYIAAWSGTTAVGSYSTYVAGFNEINQDLGDTKLFEDTLRHQVQRVVRTSSGFALLLNAGAALDTALLVFIDGNGTIESAHRLLGASYAWDIARSADTLGIVAQRETGETEFRAFAENGAALSDWICLGGASNDIFRDAAIAKTDSGFAFVFRAPVGEEFFLSTDVMGSPN